MLLFFLVSIAELLKSIFLISSGPYLAKKAFKFLPICVLQSHGINGPYLCLILYGLQIAITYM